MDAISAMILAANRKTFSAENIFRDVGAKIAGDVIEAPISGPRIRETRITPLILAAVARHRLI
jgi:hypothetical protein